jgi:hypothetical protein
MRSVIRSLVMLGAISTVACGATANTGTTGSVQTTPSGRPQSVEPSGPAQVNTSERNVIPTGQEMDVRLQNTLSSESAKVEQRFQATTAVDLMQNGRVLVPAGSTVHGVVSDVKPAGRVDRSGSMTLSFDRMTVNGRDYPIRGMATQVFESGGIREEVGTAGAGAGVGGVIGGLLGGVKGAILGAVIGAGGAIAATDGKDVELPAGSVVRIRLDQDVTVR